MSHSGENFLKGILLFLRKNLVSKSFMDEKRGYHVFPSKIFGLTVPKKFVREHFGIRKNGVSKKFMHNRGYHNFPSKLFCLTVSNNFV